ncbi:unnamed protein product [Meloidogyne enterolobii]|uniref:Uncharacterized protein n=1 Tax=Meloidogyne enterolobii TaxID=390850 RepID=A0ACB0Z505_MELEN
MNYSTTTLIISIFSIILFIQYLNSQKCIKEGKDCCDKRQCTKGCCGNLTCQSLPKYESGNVYVGLRNLCGKDKCIPENGTCSQDKINCCEGTACIVPYFTCMKCLYNGDYCDGDNSVKSCCSGDCKPKGNTTRSTCQK